LVAREHHDAAAVAGVSSRGEEGLLRRYSDRKHRKRMANKKQPNPIDIHVGSRVRLRRMMLGMSQEKLGENLGITFQQIQKYEKGTNRIGASRLQHIARVLTVPVAFFFEDAPATPGDHSAGGVAEPERTSYVVDFLSSSEGIQLNKAFVRIKDAKLRRRVIDLVRALVGEEEENG
jgi:transcriptional regulator with XRE-family HTH domain